MSKVATSNPEVFVDPEMFAGLCSETAFAPGAALRVKGLHYTNMYLLTAGEAEVTLTKKNKSSGVVTVGRGAPIGEIGFLTGRTATARVTAKTAICALVIDDTVMAALERQRPAVAAELYRQLANVAEGRDSYNLLYFWDGAPPAPAAAPAIDVRLCRNPEMLFEAQRIRYEVYCEELGRTSPFADSEKKIIADDLDLFAQVLLAVENDAPIGTMRLNAAKDGPLGALEDVYGMRDSARHPAATAICTKFIVKKSHRYGQASFKLMATSVDLGLRTAVKECYIDCIPSLLPFYKSLGFKQTAPAFLHRENGRSIPLSLDLERYASRIARLSGFVLR